VPVKTFLPRYAYKAYVPIVREDKYLAFHDLASQRYELLLIHRFENTTFPLEAKSIIHTAL